MSYYTAKAIANAFIERAREYGIKDVSPMKLQKLIFFAQSWHIKLYNRKLFSDDTKRWPYGPVVEDVYHEFKGFGNNTITAFATDALGIPPTVTAKPTLDLIDRILEVYGQYSAITLSNMTHREGSAWEKGDIGTTISEKELKEGTV